MKSSCYIVNKKQQPINNSSQSGIQKLDKFLGAYKRNGTVVHWLSSVYITHCLLPMRHVKNLKMK
jgi:hypothetical protein